MADVPEWTVTAALTLEPPGPLELHDELVVLARLEVRSDKRRVAGDDDVEPHTYGATVLSAEVIPAKGPEVEHVAKLIQKRRDERKGTPSLPLDDDASSAVSEPEPPPVDDVIAYDNGDGTTTALPVKNRVTANELKAAGVNARQYLEACALVADAGWIDAERVIVRDHGAKAFELVRASLARAAQTTELPEPDAWEDPQIPAAAPATGSENKPRAPKPGTGGRRVGRGSPGRQIR